ncbi:DUF1073 domain-containing protein [Acetobacteraceae bacterium ESL0709]|nr:DUF1073 domain-containing protein [Acetobacteraceae bacterium ESL0697]MDF7678130.1 DUF1073 domain-containing protein [Acetobacteraceae bacterium ESL0709]
MAGITDEVGQGNSLWEALSDDSIYPGHRPGYELCKLIAVAHPLGHKITAAPIEQALREKPAHTISTEPHDDVVREFERVWQELGCDEAIMSCAIQSRIYGAATITIGGVDTKGDELPTDRMLTAEELAHETIYLNVYDPLPTAGSLTIDQNPNSPDYLKAPRRIKAGSKIYTSGRFCLLMNQSPVYLSWTSSAFGFSGRSSFAQIIYDLGTYLRALRAIRMVADKAGIIVAKFEQTGSTTDQLQASAIDAARKVLKNARNGDIFSIGINDSLESLNLQNIDTALQNAMEETIKSIAAGAAMPAPMLNSEAFAYGFSGGEQDAMRVASYLMERRDWLMPLYRFLQPNIMRRAWNRDFIASMRVKDPVRYGPMGDEAIFQEWRNNFHMEWPSLIEEPESEKQKTAQQLFSASLDTWRELSPALSSQDKNRLLNWVVACVNDSGFFPTRLELS